MIALLDLDLQIWLLLAPIAFLASFVYANLGFGAGIVAIPAATLFLDLRFTIAVLVMQEIVGSLRLVSVTRGQALRGEWLRLVSMAMLGTAAGVVLLVNAPVRWLILGLGVFVLLYLASTRIRAIQGARIGRGWAWPAGFVSGACSAMFGAGGPPYVIYLNLRRYDVGPTRATLGAVGVANLVLRVAAFGFAGLFAQPGVLITGLALLPVTALGIYVGERVRNRVSARLIRGLAYAVLFVAAIGLIGRALAMPG